MTVGQIVRKNLKETPRPPLEIELILAYTLKKSREFLLTHPETKLTKLQTAKFNSLINNREKGVPVAYLTGHKEFYGLDFIINRNVLIPRPETELMAEETLRHISHNKEHVTIIDIGTGSGCIIITLAKILKNIQYPISNIQFFATDISHTALKVAEENAKIHKVKNRIKFLQSNLLEPLFKNLKLHLSRVQVEGKIKNSKILILANLPYLTPKQIRNSLTIKYEPKIALEAGPDGLNYYRQLFKQIKMLPVACYVLCEIDPSQKNKIKQLIRKELPKAKVEIKKDLRGHSRLAIINLSS